MKSQLTAPFKRICHKNLIPPSYLSLSEQGFYNLQTGPEITIRELIVAGPALGKGMTCRQACLT